MPPGQKREVGNVLSPRCSCPLIRHNKNSTINDNVCAVHKYACVCVTPVGAGARVAAKVANGSCCEWRKELSKR